MMEDGPIGISFGEVPASAAWRHHEAREGFEAVFLQADRSGYRLHGHTDAVEGGQPWVVHYVISLDDARLSISIQPNERCRGTSIVKRWERPKESSDSLKAAVGTDFGEVDAFELDRIAVAHHPRPPLRRTIAVDATREVDRTAGEHSVEPADVRDQCGTTLGIPWDLDRRRRRSTTP
jgi:hypothetical protein